MKIPNVLINRIVEMSKSPNSKTNKAKNFRYLFSILIFCFVNLKITNDNIIPKKNEIAYDIIAPPGLCAKTINGKKVNERISLNVLFISILIKM